jgi:F0F1-type ATP synthase assembly protein I
MFVYTIDDIIAVSIIGLIVLLVLLFGIAILIAKVYHGLKELSSKYKRT